MSNIFGRIAKAVYSPQFYKELLPSSEGGLGYFVKLVSLISIVYTLALGVWLLPAAKTFLDEFGAQAAVMFPADLVVNFKDGEISTNVKEPYRIPMPDEEGRKSTSRENLIVIDTKTTASPEALDKADTLILVTKSAIAFRDDNKGQVRIQDLSMLQGEEFQISQKEVEKFLNVLVPKLKSWSWVLLIGVFCGSLFANLFLLIYALIGALLVMIVGSAKGVSMGYGRAYTATLFLMTLPVLVTEVLGVAGIFIDNLPHIPFLFSILLVVAAVLNLQKSSAPVSAPQASTPSVQPPTASA